MAMMQRSLLLVFLSLSLIDAFYLPGLKENVFCRDKTSNPKCQTQVEVFVNRLDSIESILTYDYSYFDFCSVNEKPKLQGNLGQMLFGERIYPSPYKFKFLNNDDCVFVCRKKYNSTAGVNRKLKRLMKAIHLNYKQRWMIDNVPVIFCYTTKKRKEYCDRGFPVGCYIDRDGNSKGYCDFPESPSDTFHVFNHLDFYITYNSGEGESWGNSPEDNGGQIISVKIKIYRSVELNSLQGLFNVNISTFQSLNSEHCEHDDQPMKFASTATSVSIPYTYSVKFVRTDDVRWASRWDYILKSSPSEARVNWFAIVNSVFVVLLLSAMTAVVFLRTLWSDIAYYNQLVEQIQEEDQDDSLGWKLVHDDVFRPPKKKMFLCVLVGNGVQIVITLLIVLICAYFGFLSPARRGAFVSCAVISYVFLGVSAGYTSARLFKMLGGENLKKTIIMTAIACPGVLFTIFLILNFIVRAYGSSGAIPFTTLLFLLILWLGVSTPLVALGARWGYTRSVPDKSSPRYHKPHKIPSQPCLYKLAGMVLGSILPFGCIYIQLFYIFNSIWAHQYYYFFGFLLVVYFMLILTCSEATLVLCYVYLCAEDYHWWWRSFITPGLSAFYFYVYAIYFLSARLELSDFVSIFLYLGYSLILALVLFILTGTVGFLSCFWFVRSIYAAIKLD